MALLKEQLFCTFKLQEIIICCIFQMVGVSCLDFDPGGSQTKRERRRSRLTPEKDSQAADYTLSHLNDWDLEIMHL